AEQMTTPDLGAYLENHKYHLTRKIGSGGMATVFEAKNTWTNQIVAIKVLSRERSQERDSAARFKQEAQSAARLSHPNIVRIFDLGQDAATGCLYIVQ